MAKAKKMKPSKVKKRTVKCHKDGGNVCFLFSKCQQKDKTIFWKKNCPLEESVKGIGRIRRTDENFEQALKNLRKELGPYQRKLLKKFMDAYECHRSSEIKD